MTGRRIGRAIVAALLLIVLSVAGSLAHSSATAQAAELVHITGTVTKPGGNGVQNVAVTATNAGTNTIAYGPSVTAANGSYQLDVEAGNYDFHFDPANGSGFNSLVQSNVTVLSDQTINVQLVATTHTLSGTFSDAVGAPLANLQMTFYLEGTNNTVTTTTNAVGQYSGQFTAGRYMLSHVEGPSTTPNAPTGGIRFDNMTGTPYYDLTTQNTTQDFQLPTATTTVTVTDDLGNAVPNTQVRILPASTRFSMVPSVAPNYLDNLTRTVNTDAQGIAHVVVLTGQYDAGRICATVGSNQICTNTDTVVTGPTAVSLQSPAVRTFSGIFRDGSGQPMPDLQLKFYLENTNNTVLTTTAANGQFNVSMAAGRYMLSHVEGGSYVPTAPTGGVRIDNMVGAPIYDLTTQSIVQDFQLQTAKLSVTVKDNNGNLVNDAAVRALPASTRFVLAAGETANYLDNLTRTRNTDSNGTTSIIMPVGVYEGGRICATINNNQVCNTVDLSFTADSEIILQAPLIRTISGTFRDGSGQPMPNLQLTFYLYNTNNTVVVSTDNNGNYNATVNAGVYMLAHIEGGSFSSTAPTGGVRIDNQKGEPLYDTTTQNVVRDLQIPTVQLTVMVKDAQGQSLPSSVVRVQPAGSFFPLVSSDEGSYQDNLTRNRTTDSVGTATLIIPTGQYAAGRICGTVSGNQVCNAAELSVMTDTTLIFSAQPPAPDAPTNLTANSPTKNAPVLSWNAAEGAAQYDIYRDNTKIGTTANTTYTDISATQGSHVYYVVATNDTGNSAASNSATIVLDTTAPTVGSFTVPAKTVTQTKSFTAPTTDNLSGVIAGEYFYGTDPGAGNGTAMSYVGGTLTGSLGTNLPVGMYQIYVRSLDAAGNWSDTGSAKIVVTQSGTSMVSASGSFTPSTTHGDQLPQLGMANFVLSQYNLNVTLNNQGITNGSSLSFTYIYGNSPLCGAAPILPGCHKITVTKLTFSSVIFSGTNNSQAVITGTATVNNDGVSTANPFTITVRDAARAGSGTNHYDVSIYAPGDPTTLLYKASNTGTARIQ